MKKIRLITHSAIIASLYVALTFAQYMIWPESTSMAIQIRISEGLCVLAFFTPAAVPGLSLGCLLFNLTFAGTLPLDWLVGTLATLLATGGMWMLRKVNIKSYPVPGMLLPGIFNGIFVGWELTGYLGEASFWYNAACVAVGESIAVAIFGSILLRVIRSRNLRRILVP